MSRNKPITGDLIPDRNGVHNLGGPNNYFGKAYIRELVGGSISAGGGSGNKPYSTIVIAPSDCESPDAANADVVLTGTDDQAQINDIISSFGDDNLQLLFLDGTISLGSASTSGQVNLNDNMIIEGMGWDKTIFRAADGGPSYTMFYDGQGAVNVTLRNFKMEGNSAGTDFEIQGIGFGSGVEDLLIENIWIDDFGEPFETPNYIRALAFNVGVKNIVIRNNKFTNGFGSDVILLVGDYSIYGVEDVLIYGNTFENTGFNTGVYVEGTTVGAKRIILSDNNFQHTNDFGFAWMYDCSHCIVANNTGTIGWDHLVEFSALSIPCNHNVIVGNTIESVQPTNGIWLDWDGCYNNVIANNTLYGIGGTGINIGSDGATPQYNIVANNTVVGYNTCIYDEGGHTLIEGNICKPNTSDSSSNRNECIWNFVNPSFIRNNICVGRRTEVRAPRTVVSGNKFIDCIDHALEIRNEDCKISKNYFYNNNSAGNTGVAHIRLLEESTGIADRTFIRKNVFRNGTNSCDYCVEIETANCDDNLIVDNDMRNGYSVSAFLDNGTGTITTPNWT